MAAKILTSAEREKREMVASISQRQKQSEKTKAAVKAPIDNLAKAAEVAITSDPVDLGEGQVDAAVDLSGASARRHDGNTEAIRAIFEDSRKNEFETMGERYGPDHDRVVTATNHALGKYADKLAAAEASRRASMMRSGSGAGTGDGSGDPLGDGDPPLSSVLDHTDEYRVGTEVTALAPPDGSPEAVVAGDSFFQDAWDSGLSFGGAVGQAWAFLGEFTDGDGNPLSYNQKLDIIEALKAQWGPMWANDTRPVVGGANDGINSEGGYYGIIGGNGYAPAPGGETGQAGDPR